MLIFFSREKSDFLNHYKDAFEIHYFSDFSDWNNHRFIPSAFIIEGKDKHYTASILGKIRRDNEVFSALCFSTESIS